MKLNLNYTTGMLTASVLGGMVCISEQQIIEPMTVNESPFALRMTPANFDKSSESIMIE
jgi:hypothetical protein